MAILRLPCLAAECSDATDEEPEPPVPAGLRELSSALAEFCRFFDVQQ